MSLTILYVNGLPRSGTTFLMRLLGAFDNVSFVDTYPYEHRVASYLAAAYGVLTSLEGEDDPWRFEQDAARQLLSVFPFSGNDDCRHWFTEEFTVSVGAAWRHSLERLAVRLARQKGYTGDALWWAEKFPHTHEPQLVDCFGPFRLVTIVRHPVDVALSHLRLQSGDHLLWVKQAARDPATIVNHTARAVWDLIADSRAFARRHGDPPLVLRYEDAIADVPATLDRLQRHFGLELVAERASALAGDVRAMREVHQSVRDVDDPGQEDARATLRALLTRESVGCLHDSGYA